VTFSSHLNVTLQDAETRRLTNKPFLFWTQRNLMKEEVGLVKLCSCVFPWKVIPSYYLSKYMWKQATLI